MVFVVGSLAKMEAGAGGGEWWLRLLVDVEDDKSGYMGSKVEGPGGSRGRDHVTQLLQSEALKFRKRIIIKQIDEPS
ncbi:hypothetical protein Tco_1429791 [Tanacetum coccineum]